MDKKILTLCLLHQEPNILLGMKKRCFGEGRWNGFGGKVESGETIEDAAKREFLEEAGITILDIEKRGVVTFIFENDPTALEVHIFRVTKYEGEPMETEEMRPQWYHQDKVPFDSMWPDDRYWLPLFLSGKKFQGDVFFRDHDTITHHTLEEVLEI